MAHRFDDLLPRAVSYLYARSFFLIAGIGNTIDYRVRRALDHAGLREFVKVVAGGAVFAFAAAYLALTINFHIPSITVPGTAVLIIKSLVHVMEVVVLAIDARLTIRALSASREAS